MKQSFKKLEFYYVHSKLKKQFFLTNPRMDAGSALETWWKITNLHGIITQKTVTLINKAVKT